MKVLSHVTSFKGKFGRLFIMKSRLFLVLFLLLSVSCLSYARFSQAETRASSSSQPVHNLNTHLNYTTIQEAIDANETLNGQTILVGEGTYYENVVVNKALSLVGENRNTTIVDGGNLDTVVKIAVDGVSLSELTIQNSGSQWTHDFGVDLTSRKNSRIDNCTIRNHGYSVYAAYAQNNTIANNIITNASSYPLMIQSGARNNIVINNTISGSPEGVHIEDSSDSNLVAYNSISSIGYEGIYVLASNSNTIVNNEISSSGHGVPGLTYPGITLRDSSNNTVANNIILNCTGGVMAHSIHNDARAMYDVIENNTIRNCDYAIILWHEEGSIATHHQVIGNTLENNGYGLYLIGVKNNTVTHNNFIKNSKGQVVAENSTNTWDDGYPSGGNYWSDYKGVDMSTGIYQNETGSDGIGDTPCTIDTNNTDDYPLMGTFYSFTIINFPPPSNQSLTIISNSSVTSVSYLLARPPLWGLGPDLPLIIVSVAGGSGADYFCRLILPRTIFLNSSTYTVFVDSQPVNASVLLPISNSTQVYLYITYTNSALQIAVTIPEFLSFQILIIFMTATILAAIVYKRKHTLDLRP